MHIEILVNGSQSVPDSASSQANRTGRLQIGLVGNLYPHLVWMLTQATPLFQIQTAWWCQMTYDQMLWM